MVQIIERDVPRKLIETDLKAMNLPPNAWGVRLSRVHASARKSIERYLEKRAMVMAKGWGLLLYGPKGSGKTSIAAGILKTFRAYGYGAYFVTPLQLKDAVLSYTMFDDDQTILRMCMNVDILAIDDLTPENSKDPIFGASALSNLIKHRRDWQRPTLLTTSVDISSTTSDGARALGSLVGIHNAWAVVRVEGIQNANEIEQALFGE